MEETSEYIDCKICGGTGIFVVLDQQCCGYYDDEFNCCGCLILEQVREQCNECQATGLVPNHDPTPCSR